MLWTCTALSAVVAVIWLLVLAAAESWKRLRSRPLKARRTSHEYGNGDDYDDGLQPASLRAHLGWFWLVVACHLDTSETRVRKGPNTTTSSRSRQPSYSSLNSFYSLGTVCILLAFASIPLYLLLELYLLLTSNVTSTTIRTSDPNAIAPGLLIPGLTIPLRDWSILFLASIFAIAWHEAGHAITAILAKVDITSFAFILVFVFPGAYVALDKTGLESLPHASAKLRIITAGVWHNVVLCLSIWAGMQMNLLQRDSGIYTYFGYSDMNDLGVVVQIVNNSSPLNGLISQQQLITHLDDVELHDSHLYKHWDKYLLSSSEQAQNYDSLGFCVDRGIYIDRPAACCADNRTYVADSHDLRRDRQVCFLEASQADYTLHSDETKKDQDTRRGHCLDPGELLSLSRCTTSCNQNDQICIHPSPSAHLLRITTRNLSNGEEEVIMYRGRKSQLWNDVKVGRYLTPLGWMQSLPLYIENFWLYTSSISLSLALFNLLPLPRLDGGEILDTLLFTSTAMVFAPVLPFARDSKIVGSLYSDSRRAGKLDRILQRSVTILQGILANGSSTTTQGGIPQSRKKFLRIAIQSGIALSAGLSLAGNVYRQLYI